MATDPRILGQLPPSFSFWLVKLVYYDWRLTALSAQTGYIVL